MTYQTGRYGWNARGVTPLAQQLRERREHIEDIGLKALDLLGEQNYRKLVDYMPDHADYAEAVLWLQELVEVGELLQGVCRHVRMETYEDGSMRFVGGDLIEYESMTVYCADCGRSLVHMQLA